MKFADWMWLLAFVCFVCSLFWLSYEVRRLRESISKPIGVKFEDTLNVRAEK